MRLERYLWGAFGLGAGLMVAAVISVALQGPGWPYFLGIGAVALLGAAGVAVRLR